MPNSDLQSAKAPESDPLSGWSVVVREGLSSRGKAATPAEERRLGKTLDRLHPAANVALAGATALSGQVASPSFPSVLAQLSDA